MSTWVRAIAARPFARRLALLAIVGLAVRLVYVLAVMDGVEVDGDGLQFHLLANGLAEDQSYVQPLVVTSGEVVTTADKPPLYPLFLALPSALGWASVAAHRVASCLLGAITVAAIGLLGRRAGGERAGLIAAGIAAVYPMLVVLDGSLRSESLYAPLIALTLVAAYRLLDGPTSGGAAFLGALIGLTALTRTEALALLPLLVLPVVRLTPPGRRLRLGAVACAACALAVAPWLARNWVAFDTPTLSTNSGSLVYGANCDAAYFSSLIGTWPCFPRVTLARGQNEADLAADLRRRGLEYAGDHAGRLPAVVAVRTLRVWDLYEPRAQARLEAGIADRNLRAQQAGVVAYYLLLPLAIYGALLLRRRRRPLRILLAPAVLVTLLAALAYGSTRFRVPAEISILVLSGVAVGELASRLAQTPVGGRLRGLLRRTRSAPYPAAR